MSNNRKDVLAKVTGRAVYANDIQMPNMVFCKVVRSTIASGRIRSIDCSEAEKMPGVVRIFTAKDIPGIPNQPCDRPVICGSGRAISATRWPWWPPRPGSRPTRPPSW